MFKLPSHTLDVGTTYEFRVDVTDNAGYSSFATQVKTENSRQPWPCERSCLQQTPTKSSDIWILFIPPKFACVWKVHARIGFVPYAVLTPGACTSHTRCYKVQLLLQLRRKDASKGRSNSLRRHVPYTLRSFTATSLNVFDEHTSCRLLPSQS